MVSRWTSSLRLRRDSVAAGVCMVAFACPAVGWAAGGTPMPAPDDPPGGFATSSTSKPTKAATAPASRPAKRASEPAQAVPTPDAPAVSSSGPETAPKRPVTRTAPAAPEPDTSQAAPTTSTSRPVTTTVMPSHIARATPKPEPKAKPAPARTVKAKHPAAKVATTKHASPPPVAPPSPRDAVRHGLPIGVLAARDTGGGDPSGALLVTAALLLAAAAGGSTVLGVAARSTTRHA